MTHPSERRRRGQSAVETMMVVPVIMMVFIAMYQLFTITFAAQNAHARAREYALHMDSYLGSRANGATGTGVSTVWDQGMRNYKKADPSRTLNVHTWSTDKSIKGVSASAIQVRANAYIK